MSPAIFLAASVIGGLLTAVGHVLGNRAAKAAPGTDPYAGVPGLPGHPFLNSITPAVVPAPVTVPAVPAPPSLLGGLGPMVSLIAPVIEQELAAIFGNAVKAALANATAAPTAAPAAK